KDLALIFSGRPATAAALFTKNQIKAAPVRAGQQRIKGGKLQAVVINSGNANACTGARGLRDAEAMCGHAGRRLGIDPRRVFPSSTGVIGVPLPMARIRRGIDRAVTLLSTDSFESAAEAILTTDRFIKVSAAPCHVGGKNVMVAGMAKGAGMVAPNMATVLAYVLTDAVVQARALRQALRSSASTTFNCVTVDGDTSTNDTVLLLANGLAGNRAVRAGSKDEKIFAQAVAKVMKDLALKLVEDGEGATKVVEVRVENARSIEAAKKVAFVVANSKLVKTAFYGADPNFGRILAAVGYSGVPIDPEKIRVLINNVVVVSAGAGCNSNERKAATIMHRPRFTVRIVLNQGNASASVWTSDLTHEYIRINSAYRS
ncbi:MAG: bifunctional glutamate N-acetyltransferase/amino-acid acetyltransferase ArgJ, partial [Candidatus Binatia bacterium]